jgi:hypothetical protein
MLPSSMAIRTRAVVSYALLAVVAVCAIWWFSLKPSNDRAWQPDVARTAWAEQNGNILTIHNVRNCLYRTETDYDARWETRVLDLSRLQGVDIFITYWGSPYIAHPILSFVFDDGKHVAFSIETRKEVGEQYSAILGFGRTYELIYIPADEGDVIRLRTNYRKGEDVYLFRTTITPDQARALLQEYVLRLNSLHQKPEWYNALTSNCTTNVSMAAAHVRGKKSMPLDYRVIANGLGDQMMYENGRLKGGLPFDQLKKQALINPAAHAAGDSPDFSKLIRANRAGF